MRETVRRRQPPETARKSKPPQPTTGLPNHALARRLARRPAPVAGLPPIADGLTRFFDGEPRLKALAGRPAPAVDAKALDLAPAFDWLKELVDTLDLVEPIADPSMLVFESTLVQGHDGDYGHAETEMKTLLPATIDKAAPRARDLGTRVRDAVVAAMNDSSVIDHGPQGDPRLPSKPDAIKWREHATTLAALAPNVDKSGALKDAALQLEDAALAILQARAVAEARTTWRAGTVNSSAAATPHRDELDDVFADSGYSGNKAFDKPGGGLADWCGMFAAANLFRASVFDKQLRVAFAHTDNLHDFFTYTLTAGKNDDRTPLAMWAEGQWWTVEAYHASRGLKRKFVEGPDAAADIRPGDIALIRHNAVKPAASLADHIVMVESYDATTGRLITIEGNVTEGIRPGADGAADRTAGGDVKWSTAAQSSSVVEQRNMRDEHTTFQWGRPAGDVYQPSGRPTVWFVGRPSLIDFESHEYAKEPVRDDAKYISPDEMRKNAAQRGLLQNVPVPLRQGRAVPQAGGVTPEERIRGCLLGGAVGDALGAPVEFDSIEDIRARFGPDGIADLMDGAITDDTQMTLFTAEGLIRGLVRARLKGICHVPSVVDHAYARWLTTQGERSERWQYEPDGWLIGVGQLHARRAPGNTCLWALRAPRMGTVEEPLNDSKGCGGVMRVAPVGLLGGDRFDLACDIAALTHGHPSGYLAAGALAEILTHISEGETLPEALDAAERRLRTRPGHEETLQALRAGYRGEGWVAEEALGIAVHCALTAESFEHGVRLAVNHSGDSDSTGAIAGNLLGAIHGAQAIPKRWLDRLELRAEIERLIADFVTCFGPDAHPDPEALWERYPGW